VTKRADLEAKAKSKAPAKTLPLATVQPLALFGSPVLLAGEDDAAYHQLLSRVASRRLVGATDRSVGRTIIL
jgi:hypothetical protein